MIIVTTTGVRYHNLLITKLKAIGIAPTCVGWLRFNINATAEQVEAAAEQAGVPIAAITIEDQ